ncbi:hypothetical protein [Foetidibacter luteolus]|uniref:hypothetical protein n=1 Tax=Foetidibacter luteolus TaxID=2608880 RepID=UPI00129A8D90|nr:hypothetical protein [Foetidibacter luteolus]
MKKNLYTLFLLLLASGVKAQLNIESGATLFLEPGSVVTIQGSLTSNADIQGTGKIVMKGAAAQNLNMNGKAIPNLEIDNAANVALTGAVKVGSSLTFTTGKLRLGNFDFTLGNTVTVAGAGAGKFVETNGTGFLKKEITAIGNYSLPVGAGNNYTPFQYQLSGSPTLSNAVLGVQAVNAAHPSKPIRAEDYLKSYWKASVSGVTGGTLNAVATYVDAGSITGAEAQLNAIRWNGTDWSLANSSISAAANTATYNGVANNAELYAMNKFVLVKAKAFLQGAYNSGTGMMTDALRTPTNLIPLTDPYRSAPYSTQFSHVNNTVAETADAAVFNTNATVGDNIVDWVFLELRNTNASPGNTVLATRSALLQRDGDIVDVDGKSPVFFKNFDGASYIVAVRHRNHLGIAADRATYTKTLSVSNPSAGNTFDFTAATDAQIFGTNTAYNIVNAKNVLWAGNANFNTQSKYTGPANDRDYMLATILSGVQGTVINNVYSQGDLNFNRTVRYTGPANDRDYLLASILGGVAGQVRTQALPN